jgi:hypothetical protein
MEANKAGEELDRYLEAGSLDGFVYFCSPPDARQAVAQLHILLLLDVIWVFRVVSIC